MSINYKEENLIAVRIHKITVHAPKVINYLLSIDRRLSYKKVWCGLVCTSGKTPVTVSQRAFVILNI